MSGDEEPAEPMSETAVQRIVEKVASKPSASTASAVHGSALTVLGAAVAVGIASDSEAVQITSLIVGGVVALGHTALSVLLHRGE